MKTTIEHIYTPDLSTLMECPIPYASISAGYPDEICGTIEEYLDLNKHLIKSPHTTFFLRAAGTTMINAGISPGDILIVDKKPDLKNKSVVIAIINDEFTVKRYRSVDGEIYLQDETDGPETKYYNFEIWGIVTASVHTL